MTYTFDRTPEFADLRALVAARDGRVRVRTGRDAPLRQRALLHLFYSFLNGVPPITTDGGGYVHSLYVPPTPSGANERIVEAFLRRTLLERPTPMAVTIAVTDGCQCACGHCSAARLPGRRRPTPSSPPLTRSELRRVVDECLELGVGNVTFTGGEPLLRDDLEEMVALVDRSLATTQVFTNGLLLDEGRALSLKEAGLHAVHLSLDAPDAARHDTARGMPGVFAAVRRGVAAARRAGLLVGLSTYATNASVARRDLSALAWLAREWDVHEVSVFDAIPTGRLFGRARALLTGRSHRLLLHEAGRLNRRLGGRPRITAQTWTNHAHGVAWFIGCLAWNWQFHVNAWGEAMPCDFTPLTFGNVRRRSIEDIWRGATTHPEWRRRSRRCRMQSPAFRRLYVDRIPGDAALPYPVGLLGRPDVGSGPGPR